MKLFKNTICALFVIVLNFCAIAGEPSKMDIFFPLNSLYPGMYVHFEWPKDSIKTITFKAYDGMPRLDIDDEKYRSIIIYASPEIREISDKLREYNTSEPIKQYYMQSKNPSFSKMRIKVYDNCATMRFDSYATWGDNQMFYFVIALGGCAEQRLNQFADAIRYW